MLISRILTPESELLEGWGLLRYGRLYSPIWTERVVLFVQAAFEHALASGGGVELPGHASSGSLDGRVNLYFRDGERESESLSYCISERKEFTPWATVGF